MNSSDTASKAQLQTVLAPSSTNWTLDKVEAWDILDAQTTASGSALGVYTGLDLLIPPYLNVFVNVDKPMIQGLRLLQRGLCDESTACILYVVPLFGHCAI
jgi:hypothetical protein